MFIDIFIIWAAKQDSENKNFNIKKLMAQQKGEESTGEVESALGNLGKVMDMFDQINNSKWIGRAKQVLILLNNLKEFSMDVSLYLFGMFLADSIFMMVASYMSPNRDVDTNSTIQFKSLGINWNF